ncbi:energy transducer TonB [Acetobacteraceae bacterium KSS8]|uniref:Energy transducer TonB n=1 Tax=Endosaccharibacter trunci TaxID=2812733 RepID=A0ABT1W2F9_9PROT|nr:energy transducer TonB [Acetobacteraceae bacterium KSS8]
MTSSGRPAPPGVAGGPAIRAAARVRLFVPSRGWSGRGRREIFLIAAAIAIVVHVLVVAGLVAGQRLGRKSAALSPPPADNPVTLELVEDDKRYSGGAKPTPPSTPVPPAPDPAQQPARSGPPETADVPPQPAPPTETTPPDAPETAEDSAKAPAAPQPAKQAEPDIDLDPTDNFGYGRQDDPSIIPASPDKKTNKMPAYPRGAGRRGEQGSVQMLVRIAADGSVSGVDVAVSSGYPDLDSTAVKAVSGWHFRPAVRNGVATPTQMMQIFHFHIDNVPRP